MLSKTHKYPISPAPKKGIIASMTDLIATPRSPGLTSGFSFKIPIALKKNIAAIANPKRGAE